MNIIKILLIIVGIFFTIITKADNPVVNLVVGYKTVNYAGQSIQALAFNNQIPGPTLHFKEGDHVTINVYNQLKTGTSVHWHGIILPWAMDGVAYLTQAPIPPGGVFHYQFTLKQAGTYWYHSHFGMQQQQGLYGPIIIDPLHLRYKVNKDYVVLLSDWSNSNPEQITANLKKDGDYYEPRFPLQPSLLHFIQSYHQANPADRKELVDAYAMMQTMRMSPYDFSDVAYDAFLMNGHAKNDPWRGLVKMGDMVRLRFINGSAASHFRIKIPGIVLKVVAVDGNDIVPYATQNLELAPGETYDVVVKIVRLDPAIIYAESLDQLGAAWGALVTRPQQLINFAAVKSFPEPKPIMMMSGMSDMAGMADMSSMSNMPGMDMSHSSMTNMQMTPNTTSSAVSDSGTKYQNLKSLIKTNDPNKPVQTIQIVMSGYMGRFVWFINGVPEYDAKPILIEPGKRYRLIFINNTMMQHPMHVHGHWFILRNGHGAYDPLLHTIDIPPNATIVADLDAIESNGLWYFHCHNLYHMMSGMTTEFAYPYTITTTQAKYMWGNMDDDYQAMGNVAMNKNNNLLNNGQQPYVPALPVQQGGIYNSNMLEIGGGFKNFYQGSFNSLIGTDFDKLQLYTHDAEVENGILENADLDVFYWHLLSEFWAIKGGMNYAYRPTNVPYWQPGIGIAGLMPYFIDTDIRTYFHSGSIKADIDLSRDTQITNNFFVRIGVEGLVASKTVTTDEVGSGFNQLQFIVRPYYRLSPGLNIFTEYAHTRDLGEFNKLQNAENNNEADNTLIVGLSWLF